LTPGPEPRGAHGRVFRAINKAGREPHLSDALRPTVVERAVDRFERLGADAFVRSPDWHSPDLHRLWTHALNLARVCNRVTECYR